MFKKFLVIAGLLIVGFGASILIWFLVLLPVKIVQPMEFTPIEIHEDDYASARKKLRLFSDATTAIDLNREEISALLKISIEEELKIDITDIFVDFDTDKITTIMRIRISDIPSVGYLTYILHRKDTEYTTTLISAQVRPRNGNLCYHIDDFIIGKFKIPEFIIQKIIKEEVRSFNGLSITALEFHKEYIHIERN